MRRRLFTIASALSLLLCVATVVLWISTYFCAGAYNRSGWRESAGEFRVYSATFSTGRGEILLDLVWRSAPLNPLSPSDKAWVDSVRRFSAINRPHVRWYSPHDIGSMPDSLLGMAGFAFWSHPLVNGAITMPHVGCALPLWCLVLLFGLTPAARPTLRIINAVRHAPPASAHRKRDRLLTTLAVIAVGLFVLIHVVIHATRTIGWSARFATRGGTFIEIAAQQRKLSLACLTGWPQAQPLTFIRRPDEYRPLFPFWEAGILPQSHGFLGMEWVSGDITFHIESDGTIALLPFGKNFDYGSSSARMPYRQFRASLFQIGLLVIALPTWLAFTRVRRKVKRYTDARDSLCVRCGYSLAGNTSGVCPECGTTVTATSE